MYYIGNFAFPAVSSFEMQGFDLDQPFHCTDVFFRQLFLAIPTAAQSPRPVYRHSLFSWSLGWQAPSALTAQHIVAFLHPLMGPTGQGRAEERVGHNPPWCLPSTPRGTDPGKIIWLNLQAKLLDWDCSAEQHKQKLPFFRRLHPTWHQRNLYSPMLTARKKKRLDQNFFVPAYPSLTDAEFLGFIMSCCTIPH